MPICSEWRRTSASSPVQLCAVILFSSHFHWKLNDLRVERKLTLEELSEQTGISKSALSNYEINDYKDISHYSIATLAKFYEERP